jgi:hypothetical protein
MLTMRLYSFEGTCRQARNCLCRLAKPPRVVVVGGSAHFANLALTEWCFVNWPLTGVRQILMRFAVGND